MDNKKGGKKWHNQLEAAAAVKAVIVVLVKAEAVEKVPADGPARLETVLAEAEIMLPQKAKASN